VTNRDVKHPHFWMRWWRYGETTITDLGKTTVADLTFDKVGFLLTKIKELEEELHGEGSFFVFATLVTYKINNNPIPKSL